MPYATRLDPNGAAQIMREATVQPATWNEADRSFEVIWTTGAAVVRFDWYDGDYYDETLGTEPANVRLDRLNDGGPVLVDHIARVGALAGSVVPGSARMEGGKGIARVRLTDAPDMADTVSKVRDGHLRTVSVSYHVHTFERTRGQNGARDVMHATDWEPVEISLTPVPADPGATIRSRSETEMPDIIENDDPQRQPRRSQTPRQRTSMATEALILERCSRASLSREFERGLLDQHEEEPMTQREMERAIGDEIVRVRQTPHIDSRQSPRTDAVRDMRDAFGDALYARLSGAEPTERAREYAGASMIDMARGLLEARGERVRWLRPAGVLDALSRAGHVTAGDFAHILDTAGRRYLLDAYGAYNSPLRLIARKRDFVDFRTRYGVQAEGPAYLMAVAENAEFKRVMLKEAANGVKLGTYGGIFGITRQALVNDDLGVFSQMATFWARAQAGTEAAFFTGLIAGNGVVLEEDNKTLYHADHGNVAASGGPITVANLGAARASLRTIKNRDGETNANVTPKYLVVGPAKETQAEQVLAEISASQPSEVNPFSGKLELVVDANQTGNSWRLFADPGIFPVLEYGNLEGQDGLYTETRIGFDVDGVEMKARTDIGAGAIDYRGTYLNPGD
ncbi:Mu-like prophage major head subunit gpT family protein [Sphingobium naphthae]|nr:Mu-like prophage major head subunit gpT family protein [Sphingobium naphthae]